MFRGPCNGNGNGNGYGQPHPTTNYHRTHSGEHVTKVAQRPCHAGGAVQHHVVHKESFKEVDEAKAPANRRCFDNYPMKMKANNAMAANHHGGGSHHRYEIEKTYEETCEEETYAYGAGGRHFEYKIHEETYEEEEEEEEEEEDVVGGGGCAQLRRPCRRA